MSQQARSISLAVGLCLAAASSATWSQMPPPPPPMGAGLMVVKAEPVRCVHHRPEAGERSGAPDIEKQTLDAPYSAVGVTEVVQTLGDGNRIVRKNTMRYFRDSQGRTRTEFELAHVGPVALGAKHTVVTIHDPVANTRTILHPEAKRADVIKAAAGGKPGLGRKHNVIVDRRVEGGPGGPANVAMFSAAPIAAAPTMEGLCDPRMKSMPAPVSLGERTIEGLKSAGSRLEFTIPAGEFGNELPMTVRSEQWFSPELGVVVSSTHSDPMSGETTYRLTQISRTEPDAQLFTIPAEYTVNEMAGPQFHIELRSGANAAEDAGRPQRTR